MRSISRKTVHERKCLGFRCPKQAIGKGVRGVSWGRLGLKTVCISSPLHHRQQNPLQRVITASIVVEMFRHFDSE